MKVQKDCVVAVQYVLRVMVDGNPETVEETQENKPLRFVLGAGLMLDAFENALMGKEKGDRFEIKILCKDAYQEPDDEFILDLPKSTFEDENGVFSEEIQTDSIIELEDEQGHVIPALVLSIDPAKDGKVKVDTNHPLAGYDLHFEGEIEEVRLATQEEKENPEMLMDQE